MEHDAAAANCALGGLGRQRLSALSEELEDITARVAKTIDEYRIREHRSRARYEAVQRRVLARDCTCFEHWLPDVREQERTALVVDYDRQESLYLYPALLAARQQHLAEHPYEAFERWCQEDERVGKDPVEEFGDAHQRFRNMSRNVAAADCPAVDTGPLELRHLHDMAVQAVASTTRMITGELAVEYKWRAKYEAMRWRVDAGLCTCRKHWPRELQDQQKAAIVADYERMGWHNVRFLSLMVSLGQCLQSG